MRTSHESRDPHDPLAENDLAMVQRAAMRLWFRTYEPGARKTDGMPNPLKLTRKMWVQPIQRDQGTKNNDVGRS